jgi:hypothetical protein
MIPALREEFNRKYTPEKYQDFLRALDRVSGTHVGFRVSETPCFVPYSLIALLSQYGRELVSQLVDNPDYRKLSDVTIPPEYHVPNEAPLPMFVQVDFGLIRNSEGELEPKLVELQAFPSLYGYQPTAAEQYVESFGLSRDLGIYLSGCDREAYWRLMRHLIVANHDPENVILMEIDPDNQKTLPDFLITERELGIAVVDILKMIKRGNKLFYKKDGRECGASTTAASSMSSSARTSRCRSIFATSSMSSGPAIPTGTSASASFPFHILSIPRCPGRGFSTSCRRFPKTTRTSC